MRLQPYIHLLRLHQPVGILLLFWPCAWSLAMSARGLPPDIPLLLFAAGALVMRAAGCIINDMTDRKFDQQVARTKTRPLASGSISMQAASIVLAILLLMGLAIANQLGTRVLIASLCAVPLVIAYPWMKRWTWWPQLFLGITFNWGALVGWLVLKPYIEPATVLLYAGGIFWTLGYDTIYAHQDIKDDAIVGVKSSARRLGENTLTYVRFFYMCASLCWIAAGWAANYSMIYIAAIMVIFMLLLKQVCSVSLSDPKSCQDAFISNRKIGAWLFIACIIGA